MHCLSVFRFLWPISEWKVPVLVGWVKRLESCIGLLISISCHDRLNLTLHVIGSGTSPLATLLPMRTRSESMFLVRSAKRNFPFVLKILSWALFSDVGSSPKKGPIATLLQCNEKHDLSSLKQPKNDKETKETCNIESRHPSWEFWNQEFLWVRTEWTPVGYLQIFRSETNQPYLNLEPVVVVINISGSESPKKSMKRNWSAYMN